MKTMYVSLVMLALMWGQAAAIDCESYPHDDVIKVGSTGELDVS